VATLIGLSVQQMVAALHQQRASAARTARQLAVVGDVLRSMQAGEDARAALCKGVHQLSGAAVSVLVEPFDDQLVGTAVVGADLAGLSVPLRGEASAVVEVYWTGRRLFIGDARLDPRVSPRLRELTRAVSVLYEPVVRRGLVVAVLVAVWTEQVPFDHEHVSAVGLLGVEAAVAIERADLLAALERSARTDSLTGLANRRAWDEQLPAALGAATGPVCLAALDLDRFKSYNDAFGHPAGDGLLRDAGDAWQAQLRSGDLLARYGGEEFLVLLPDCDLDSARPVLERLRLATPNGQTVSVGLAQWDGTETARQLMARADAALYAAKREGRDRLHLTA
ncbi:MAG TPA: sensor domain-containing diguanylate cyclase, partial [Candidatus Eisenbacteria bacterium]|nr:sensor domain-containing diguanylate cyclase [Candidatus Eisenbacteria bacterium]